MSLPARVALLLLLTLGFVRLTAAEPEEIAALRLKAERGNALAQYNLGLAYAQGRLVPVDLSEAFVWLSLASESGATGKALDSVLGSISDNQLANGQSRLGTYRTALAAKNATSPPAHLTPKLASRGFSLAEPVTASPPINDTEPATPVTKSPEPVAPPIATSPAEGTPAGDLAEARKNLETARADLASANAEIATLRASIASLAAAATAAKATEARLTTELNALRPKSESTKPPAVPPAVENPKATDPAPHQP
jgi:hypothetical protein